MALPERLWPLGLPLYLSTDFLVLLGGSEPFLCLILGSGSPVVRGLVPVPVGAG